MFRPLIAPVAVACLCALNPLVHAQTASPNAAPVNEMCPIGREPIVPDAGVVEHKGRTIGLCCPGCGEAFLAWDTERKDEFVALAIAHREPGQERSHHESEPPQTTDHASAIEAQLMHYPIDTCIVTGGKLGSMGEPVNHVHDGRLVRFCCDACIPTFQEDPERFLAALDEKIIAAQLSAYPLDTCVVAGGKLGSMGEPVNHTYQNRLVRFCCAACVPGFEAEPQEFMATLDAAYADQQRGDYALDTCVVSGAPLGSMGEPVELVAGATLVRFCCDGCVPEFRKSPAEYLSKLPQH